MILIVGATGKLGNRIAGRLRSAGQPVRALCRTTANATAVSALGERGVECISGDLRDGNSLIAACHGAEVVISTATGLSRPDPADSLDAVDRQGHFNLLQAAEEAGVQRFVFVSFAMPAEFRLDFPMWEAKRAVEQRLRGGGMEYTIFHPAPFMESWLAPAAGFDYERGIVRLTGDGHNPISFISVDDVAAYVAAAVYNPRAKDRVFPVGGAVPVTWLEAVSRFEQAMGRSFRVEKISAASVRAQLEQAVDAKLRSILALTLGTSDPWVIDPAETANALGSAPEEKTLDGYIKEVIAALKASHKRVKGQ